MTYRREWSRSCLRILRIGLALGLLGAAPAAAQLLYGGLVGSVDRCPGRGRSRGQGRRSSTPTPTSHVKRPPTRRAPTRSRTSRPALTSSRCHLQGFREAVQSAVPVRVGQISRVDLTLQVGAMSETITVQSAAELLQTDKADVHTELRSTEITNLPLNRFRNYQALVVLVPGSLPPAFQNAETDTPQRSLNMTVNGQDGAANTTLTDGTRNVNVGLPHHNVYIAPAETIESVNITTSSMDAEEGMAAGVAITVITKSGTNTLQGLGVRVLQQREAECVAVLLRADSRRRNSRSSGRRSAGRSAVRSGAINCSFSDRTRATSAGRSCSPSSTCRARRFATATSATRSTRTERCSGSTTRCLATSPPARAACSSRTTSFRPAASTRSRNGFRTSIRCRTSRAPGPAASRATTGRRATPTPIDTTTTPRSTGTGRRRISSGANTAT